MLQCLTCSNMPDSQKQTRKRTSFHVPEVAACLQVDERTLRRWCEIGLVRNARRSGRGGGKHWRIRGGSVSGAAAAILRDTRGHARPRKKTMSGKTIPQKWLKGVARIKDRMRLRHDDTIVEWSIAASRGESFAPGEWSFDLLMNADKTQRLATAFAVLIIESGTGADHARIIGARFGWSRATFYRKYGKLLPTARRIATEYLADVVDLDAPEQRDLYFHHGPMRTDDESDGRARKPSAQEIDAENAHERRIGEWLATLAPDELASAAKLLPEARRLIEKRRAAATSA